MDEGVGGQADSRTNGYFVIDPLIQSIDRRRVSYKGRDIRTNYRCNVHHLNITLRYMTKCIPSGKSPQLGRLLSLILEATAHSCSQTTVLILSHCCCEGTYFVPPSHIGKRSKQVKGIRSSLQVFEEGGNDCKASEKNNNRKPTTLH